MGDRQQDKESRKRGMAGEGSEKGGKERTQERKKGRGLAFIPFANRRPEPAVTSAS